MGKEVAWSWQHRKAVVFGQLDDLHLSLPSLMGVMQLLSPQIRPQATTDLYRVHDSASLVLEIAIQSNMRFKSRAYSCR